MVQIVFSWFLDILSAVSIYVCTIVTSDYVIILCKENNTDNKFALQYIRYKYTLLLTQYFSVDKIRKMSWEGGHVTCMGKRRAIYRVLVGET